MKLLYITNGITGPGGLERILSLKASSLAENYGYEVNVLSLNELGIKSFYDFSSTIKFHNIEVKGNSLNYFISYTKGMRRKVSEISPDIIIVCDDGLKGFFLPLLLGKPCPMIYERHVSKNIFFNENSRFFAKFFTKIKFLLMNFLAKNYDKFIILSEGTREEWKLDNIMVVPNMISFYPNEAAKLSNKTVVAVGKQSYQKGYDRLLQSWVSVNKKHPDWVLNIYGKSDSSQKLLKLATKLNIKESVFFFEPVKNIDQKYLESSIYVMSSRYEGFPMVLLEAMACGLPCVSFNCPTGPEDIIKNGEDGFLIENNDTEEFALAINFLIENEDQRQIFGNKARRNIERFNSESIMSVWDSLLRSLLT
jgi:glycosyltransferase involved in cell wall biosynthesis